MVRGPGGAVSSNQRCLQIRDLGADVESRRKLGGALASKSTTLHCQNHRYFDQEKRGNTVGSDVSSGPTFLPGKNSIPVMEGGLCKPFVHGPLLPHNFSRRKTVGTMTHLSIPYFPVLPGQNMHDAGSARENVELLRNRKPLRG